MSDLEKILDKLLRGFERAARMMNVGVAMQQLMVLQLDGKLEVSDDTMNLYLVAMEGSKKGIDAFRKHLQARYFSRD